jgi:hypothetical protein
VTTFLEASHYCLNQTLAEAGLPIVMPEQWPELDALAATLEKEVSVFAFDEAFAANEAIQLAKRYEANIDSPDSDYAQAVLAWYHGLKQYHLDELYDLSDPWGDDDY